MSRVAPSAKVFMSAGREYLPGHAAFLQRIRDTAAILNLEVSRLVSDETYYNSPLSVIIPMIQHSFGAIVVAFPRFVYRSGVEYPASMREVVLAETHLTTVWNQIESALVLQYQKPILTLVENRVRAEGLLSPRRDEYHVLRYDLDTCQRGLPTDILAGMREFACRVHAFQESAGSQGHDAQLA